MKKLTLLKNWVLTSLLLLVPYLGKGADVKEISPITDKILMIHFNDGHIDYTGLGESNFRNFVMHYEVLNITNATNKANYTIKSADDSNYGSAGKIPANLGRKSKMAHVGDMFDGTRPNYLSSHFIYIELPNALVPGRTYTIVMNNLASSSNEWTFVYNPSNMRSETIHVNQVGYRNNAKKYAYLSQYMGSFNAGLHTNGGLNLNDYGSTTFRVVRADDGTQVYSGSMSIQKSKTVKDSESTDYGPNKNFTNADVWQCDFSSVTTPGYYKIVVDRMGCSYPFEIKDDVYRDPLYAALRSMFYQRAGVYKELDEYNNLVYPASHVNNAMYFRDAGRGEYQEPTDLSKPVTGVWGWYFDAGDWDCYLHAHAKVPALMLMVYDMNPTKFRDGDVGNRWKRNIGDPWIDEGTNGIPDILDEAKWLIDYMKRARERLQAHGYGTGGVPHYVGVDAGAIGGASSWTDNRKLNLTRQDAGVTAMHAGLAAWLSACLQKAGRPQSEIDYYKNEAISAYNWAKSNGNLADATFKREFRFGAAGLYRATGSTTYQTDYINNYAIDNWEYWAGPEWDQMAACMYSMIPDGFPNLNTSHRTTVRNAVKSAADNWVNSGQTRGFRASHITPNQRNFLGVFGTPRTMMQAVTYHFSGEQKYYDATQFSADYCLGGNPMNMVWMSGVGHFFDEQPFHPDSWYLIDYNHKAYDNPILPGFVTYGTHYDCDFFGCGWAWEGDEDYSRSSAYPACTNSGLFPQAEARFPNRVNIPGSEYTIHQNQLHAIFTYGYLASTTPASFTPNARPTVSLQLSQNQQVPANANLQLQVTASTDTRKVDYYYDWQLIGTSTDRGNGFLLNWDVSKYKVNIGQNYLITAKAYDTKGLISVPTSGGEKTIQIVSGSSNNPPTVSITSPSSGTNYTAPATINITANASDSDGSISKVEFYQGAVKIGEKTSSPYTFTWSNVTAGSYVLTAKAYDNLNAVTTSAAVNVTVSSVITQTPYGGTARVVPGRIEAEDFDNGGQGIAYNDSEPANQGGAYRLTEGVDIQASSEGGYNVGWTSAGEWLEYTINVQSAGNYKVEARVASQSVGASLTITFSNGNVSTGNMTSSATGGWQTWTTISKTGVPLQAGEQVMRVYMDGGSFNLNYIDITAESSTSVTGVTVLPTSATITVGNSQQLTETVSPPNATNKNVDWGTSNAGVATVNASGLVTGVGAGTATITVTTEEGNYTATSVITVIEQPACTVYQAESNYTGSGVTVSTGQSGYTGTGFIDYGGQNSYAEWNISVATAGSYTFKLRYGNGSTGNRQCEFRVNGSARGNIPFAPTGAWTTWTIVEFTTNLSSGNNVIRIVANTSTGGPNLDNYEVCGGQTVVNYTLTTSSPNGSISRNPNQSTFASGSSVTLTAIPASGYTFSNWSGDASGDENPLTIIMNEDKDITANFSLIPSNEVVLSPLDDTYARSDNASTVYGTTEPGELNLRNRNPGGSLESIRYTYIKFQVPTNPSGKSIQSAALNLFGYNYNSSQTTEIEVVHAGNSWTEETLTWNNKPSFLSSGSVTFNFPFLNNSSGSVDVDVSSLVTAYAGQTITLALRIKSYVNDELIKFASKENTTGYPAPSLTITYEEQTTTNYTLTTSSPNGSIIRNPNQSVYASGTQVTLTAIANSGYTFTGWSVDASGTTNPLVIIMNTNKNITANFALQTVPDCILANPSFESDLQNWTINSGTIGISSNATDGVKSARLFGTNAGMEQGYVKTVAQGTAVTVSFDAYIAGSVGWAGVGLDFKASDNSDILKQNIQITNTAWQSRTIVANAPAGTEKLVVWAYTSSGELFVDNFCITGTGLKSGSEVTLLPANQGVHFNLYPNPSMNGFVYLKVENHNESEDLILNVYDISSRKIFSRNIEIKGESIHSIDCNNLNKGIYFFNIRNNQVDRTIKVVLQ